MGQLLGMKGRSVMYKLTTIKKKQFFKNYILWIDGERERERREAGKEGVGERANELPYTVIHLLINY